MAIRECIEFPVSVEKRSGEEQESAKLVSGYAALFNKSAVLYRRGGTEIKEVIDEGAFDGADMSDVILNINHDGRPCARTRNGTLRLTVDQTGLKVEADLSGTQAGRELYEEIRGGYLDRMSFSFVVAAESYDYDTDTRHIVRFDRIYDVSAVSFPAYKETSLNARGAAWLDRSTNRDKHRKLALKARLLEDF